MSLRTTVLAGVAAVWLLSFATLGVLTTQLSTTHARLLVLQSPGAPAVVKTDVVQEPATTFAAAFNRRFVVVLTSVAVLTIIAALVLTDRLVVRPIEALRRATESMERGAPGPPAASARRDEIGALGRSLYALSQRLKLSEERRKAMVADIAHELRTPLTNLRGAIESLQDGMAVASPQEFEALHADVMLLDRLIADLHQLSLGDAGKLDLACVPCDIVAELRAAANGSTRIVLDVTTDLPQVLCDLARARQIVGNIVSNALRYAPEGPIVLRARSEAKSVNVSIEDRGPGFPPDRAEALFERFYRVDNSRTRETGGTGIGLAVAKQLVEAQGGRITARVNKYGGATFSFTLPRARPAEP
jgi:two-component system, OmpR family, sensor histidine kinase BaeS